jgi:N-acetylneuraminic acid mutarotase
MTGEREFDALLRSWFDETAPSDQPQGLLDAVVTTTGHTRPRPAWLVGLRGGPMPGTGRPGVNRFAPLAVAATALIVAVLIGIRLLIGPPNVGPPPIPGPTPSSALESNTPPGPTDSASAWTATGGMIEARNDYAATLLLDGTVLVSGGGSVDDGHDLTSAELYDPATGTWTATGSMVSWARGSATRLLDGKVLVTNDGLNAELYDPSNGSWTATKNVIAAIRASETATLLLDGRVLVTGVSSSSEEPFSTAAELYDPKTGSWTTTGAMIEPRFAYTATRLTNGKVLVSGGTARGGPVLTSAELYDPSTGSWTVTGSMNDAHADGHIGVLLDDGRVLVAGGYNSLGPDPLDRPTSAELYDPGTGSWTVTGSMNDAHGLQTATLLPNGTVLVGGDSSHVVGVADPPAMVELYDPTTGNWIATAAMIEVRSILTATLLLDGRVLVTGQWITTGGILALAELYDPGSGL